MSAVRRTSAIYVDRTENGMRSGAVFDISELVDKSDNGHDIKADHTETNELLEQANDSI